VQQVITVLPAAIGAPRAVRYRGSRELAFDERQALLARLQE
jgi:hypothetical protein